MNFKTKTQKEYFACIQDLIYLPEVQQLDLLPQHGSMSRLRHSMCVSFMAFRICRFLHFDSRSAARAGLLHDLFFYDAIERKIAEPSRSHILEHPLDALENAKSITDLNPKEENIIASHMFPLCRHMPRYMESFIVSHSDKTCAVKEGFDFIGICIKRSSKRLALKIAVILRMF